MRITTRFVFDMETGQPLYRIGYNFDGRVDLCKGDPTAAAAEQRQAGFDNQLMSLFQAQYGKQSAITDYLTGKMRSNIDAGGNGIGGQSLVAMRTGATDQLSHQFDNARKAVGAFENTNLPSGVNAQISGSLLGQEALAQSSAQNQITLDNENLKQQNYWRSIDALNGQAANVNPLGYANSATSGSGAVSNLSSAVTAANGPGIGSILGGIAGGVAGAAGGAGGFGKLFSCWIAVKLFGSWLDPRVIAVRRYIFGKFSKTWYGRPVAALYARHGEWMSRQPAIVWALRPAFELALSEARRS